MYIATFAESAPERAAVVMGESGRRITYKELDEGSLRFARVLYEAGLRPGDHYAVLLENHPFDPIEFLNTAIEKLADRLTTDHDPQIGRVKDMGSAAVGVALVMAGLFWLFAIAERMGVV